MIPKNHMQNENQKKRSHSRAWNEHKWSQKHSLGLLYHSTCKLLKTVNFSLVLAPRHEDVCSNGGIVLLFLDFGTKWRWVVSFTSSQPRYMQLHALAHKRLQLGLLCLSVCLHVSTWEPSVTFWWCLVWILCHWRLP